jgi:hypothetical protein
MPMWPQPGTGILDVGVTAASYRRGGSRPVIVKMRAVPMRGSCSAQNVRTQLGYIMRQGVSGEGDREMYQERHPPG